jgi:hypothetical protein
MSIKSAIENFKKKAFLANPEVGEEDVFPEGWLDYGIETSFDEIAVKLFLDTYRNPLYSTYYETDCTEESLEIVKEFEELYGSLPENGLSFKTATFSYKLVGLGFLWTILTEVGEKVVGVTLPGKKGE